ncbi:MAG: hypothetical protein ACI85I_001347 [Arenicella sp.]|jgi:hypothetical protein
MILDYFAQIKSVIKKYAHIISDFSSTEKTYSENKGFIDGEVIFTDESKLDFAEVKDAERAGKMKYCYHYMDEEQELIFRYDNAKHYPDLPNFPHHKHSQSGVEESQEPELDSILSEIEAKVMREK